MFNPLYSNTGYSPAIAQQRLNSYEQYNSQNYQNPQPQQNFSQPSDQSYQQQYYPYQGGRPQVMPQQVMIKCTPVTSIDEAKASMVDLDGSVQVFTDLGNKKIYTKQINLDGTASLKVYGLTDAPAEPEPVQLNTSEFIKKSEVSEIIAQLEARISDLSAEISKFKATPAEQSKPSENGKNGGK